jgi:hypothetical protein
MKDEQFNKHLEKVLELIYKIEIQAKKDLEKDRRESGKNLYSYNIKTEYRC